MTASIIPMPPVRHTALWRGAQGLALVLLVLLLAALARWPEPTLHVLWDMVIPILPAVFLVNPLIWRNVCPLATLNDATDVRSRRPALTGRGMHLAWAGGVILLAVLVPARRFLFNENGLALLAVIGGVAGLGVMLGLVFTRRSGFCNAICPVLPVERLYGQAPLVEIGSPRCPDCNFCSPVGCIDLAHGKSFVQALGRSRNGAGWLLRPLGIFAAAFPGFVVGYFTTENVPAAAALQVYGHVAWWSILSLGATAVVVVGFGLTARSALPALGGLAAILYYWLGAPNLAAAYGAPNLGPPVIRVLALALVGAWLARSVRRPSRTVVPSTALPSM